jgi:hypothetical protein
MIRTKCPSCGKLLGVNDGAAGTVAQCPMCEQKFRVPAVKPGGTPGSRTPAPRPAQAPARPPVKQEEDFPEVEIDEEAAPTPRRPTRPVKRPPRPEDEEEVAELDSDDVEVDEEEEERPRRKPLPRKKKKKRGRDKEEDAMVLRNRIVGSIGAVGGVALTVVGVAKWLPAKLLDPEQSVLGSAAPHMWWAPTIFGVIMVLVGVYYVFKTD